MGSKSSKWLAASLIAAALAVVPASALANLDYSRNSVNGQYLPSAARVVPQINDISVPSAASPAPAPVVTPVARPGSSFAWGDAFAGAGVALLLALAGGMIVRRRHASPLVS